MTKEQYCTLISLFQALIIVVFYNMQTDQVIFWLNIFPSPFLYDSSNQVSEIPRISQYDLRGTVYSESNVLQQGSHRMSHFRSITALS